MSVDLMTHQKQAAQFLGTGKILYGGVGSGKSLTALSYYVKSESPKPLIVITTAKKRDSVEWIGEAAKMGIGTVTSATLHGVIKVDSWNNIENYVDVEDAFFIFDEQRLVGNGTWVKAFLKIAKRNHWIMLTATPGDTWMDYAPVFVANGWYKNITEFKREHVVYAPFIKYPKIQRYIAERKLENQRNEVLVEMPYLKHTRRHVNWLQVGYDEETYDFTVKKRWNLYEDRPAVDVSEMFRLMRKITNTDPSRMYMVNKLMTCHKRLIIFYNFNYELEILKMLTGSFWLDSPAPVAEWNGHKKEPIPDTDRWVYLVQYNAGAEGWNCTSTDAMVLYSLPYSYKIFEQAQGRIDRLDSAFIDLYYYILVSSSGIDRSVRKALDRKKNFNERQEAKKLGF